MLTTAYRLPFRVLASPFRLLHTIVEHRALLRQMIARDVTARFVGTSLGAVWSLIQPFILLCLYTFVFGVIYRVALSGRRGGLRAVFILWPVAMAGISGRVSAFGDGHCRERAADETRPVSV